jgi:hypothetical protein
LTQSKWIESKFQVWLILTIVASIHQTWDPTRKVQ